jgi:ABC-type uncharacterized transport system fused permease/ATPase subunit
MMKMHLILITQINGSLTIRGALRHKLERLLEVISALLTFLSFIIVLWTINGRLALLLLVYSVAGTGLIVFASRKLVSLNYQH